MAMHNGIKKCLFTAAVVIFIFSLTIQEKGFAGVKSAKDGEYAYNILTNIGVLEADINYSAEKSVSRGLFTKLALEISGNGAIASAAEKSAFTDVPSGSVYRPYIDKAYELGYIQGEGTKLFRPDDNITAVEAVCILSNILGYTQMAENSGEFPSNYMRIALRYKLTAGITVSYDTVLNMEQALQMLYNAVQADYYTISSVKHKTMLHLEEGEDTLLAAKFDIYKYEGIVTATAYTDLKSEESQAGRGEALVDNYKFIDKSGIERYLGYNVMIYYTDNGQDTPAILYSEPNANNNTVTNVNVRDIVTEANGIRLEGDSRTKTIRFDADASYIVNGKLADITYKDLENIEKGYVNFICNDKDGKIDVACITGFASYVVDGVSGSDYVVRSKEGETVELDPNDDEYDTFLIKDDTAADFSSITVGSVILVAESQGKGINKKYVLISEESADGILNGIDEDIIIINDEEYFYDKGAILTGISVGESYRFSFDYFGNVVYINRYNELVYGYLKFLAEDIDADKVLCRIFTENNRWVSLYLDEKVKLDGEKFSSQAVYNKLNAGSYRQMIRYTVNQDAEITRIDTAADAIIGTAQEKNAREQDKFRISYRGTARWKSSVLSLGGNLFLSGSAKIFVIPSSNAEEDFRIISPASFANDQSITITAYDADEHPSSPIAMVNDFNNTLSNTDKLMIITGKKQIYLNDETLWAVKGYWNGLNVTLPVEIDAQYGQSLSQQEYDNLSKGDIIRFTYNDSGCINMIEKHNLSNGAYYNYGGLVGSPSFVGGIVKNHDYSMRQLAVEYTDNGNICGFTYNTSTPVYIYYRDTNEVETATASEILKGDVIFAQLIYLQCNEIIVFRY